MLSCHSQSLLTIAFTQPHTLHTLPPTLHYQLLWYRKSRKDFEKTQAREQTAIKQTHRYRTKHCLPGSIPREEMSDDIKRQGGGAYQAEDVIAENSFREPDFAVDAVS